MFDSIYLVRPGTNNLVSPYETIDGKTQLIQAAQSFSVSLKTVVVAEDLDGFLRGKNDILIMTRSALGEQPRVERVHFYGEEIEKGKRIRNMFAELAFVVEDYNPADRLWLELAVLEIDSDTGERKAAVNAFNGLAASAGAVFPALIPYTFGASAVVGLVEKLVSILEEDEDVIRMPISLHGGSTMIGEMPLQVGTYVVFPKPIDSEKWKLSQAGTLQGEGAQGQSYVVFNVAPEKRVSHTHLTSQKIATLLTQLRDGNPNSARSAIEFLGETMETYSNFRKLERFLKLKEKKPSDLTDAEKDVLEAIKQIDDLKPFLPK